MSASATAPRQSTMDFAVTVASALLSFRLECGRSCNERRFCRGAKLRANIWSDRTGWEHQHHDPSELLVITEARLRVAAGPFSSARLLPRRGLCVAGPLM